MALGVTLTHPGSKRRILHTESRGKLSCRHSAALKLIEHRIAQLARRPHAPGSIDFKNLFRFRIHRLRNVWITQFTATELRRRYALRLRYAYESCVEATKEAVYVQKDFHHPCGELPEVLRQLGLGDKENKRNNLPGLQLEQQRSVAGDEMVLVKRVDTPDSTGAVPTREKQLTLIEIPPLESAWQNVLAALRQDLGPAVVKSWLEPCRVDSLEVGKLTMKAPPQFLSATDLNVIRLLTKVR